MTREDTKYSELTMEEQKIVNKTINHLFILIKELNRDINNVIKLYKKDAITVSNLSKRITFILQHNDLTRKYTKKENTICY